MTQQSEKILITGYFGNSNFGDELILSLKLEELESQPVDITVVSSDPRETSKEFNVKSIQKFNPFSIIAETMKTDILLFPGGGIFQDETSFLSLCYYIFHIILAKMFFTKVKLEKISVGPITKKFSPFLLKVGLKNCDISVRDRQSIRILKAAGLTQKIKLEKDRLYDLKFPERKVLPEKFVLGIQLRNWVNIDRIIPALSRLLNELIPKYKNLELIFLEFQETDKKILTELINDIQNKDNIQYYSSIDEILKVYPSLDFLIGMRFHSILLADILNVPVFGISYAPKCLEILNGMDSKFIEMRDFDTIYFEERVQKEFERLYKEKFQHGVVI